MAAQDEPRDHLAGLDQTRPIDAIFVNAALRDYDVRPRVNDFTLPVLGLGYIATAAAEAGFNVAVLDSEALGMGVRQTIELVNDAKPRWVGFNLLAPTYELSALIASGLSPSIKVMVGGHQAKAMPNDVLLDERFVNLSALVLGEGEPRVVELLRDEANRKHLPGVLWRDKDTGQLMSGSHPSPASMLSPNINEMPFVDRRFLTDDPYLAPDGRIEANIVGARGCPYDCSFCGAAVSANSDISIRTREPSNIIREMDELNRMYGATAFRFVDDLFLGHKRFIQQCSDDFEAARVGERFVWDATGRINVLNRLSDDQLMKLRRNGCREIALGVESGSARLLEYMGKRITPEMTLNVVKRVAALGISVKGYFILGFPTETREELAATAQHVRDLWDATEGTQGQFRASVFEFRPYPGTPEWDRLMSTGRFTPSQLRSYDVVDLTSDGLDEAMRGRDEFNFSVNLQFGEATVAEVQAVLSELSIEQYERRSAVA